MIISFISALKISLRVLCSGWDVLEVDVLVAGMGADAEREKGGGEERGFSVVVEVVEVDI